MHSNKKAMLAGMASMSMLFGLGQAQAAVTGKVEVSLNVAQGCEVTGGGVDGDLNDFGILDFGDVSTTWTNVLSAELAGVSGGTLQVECSKDLEAFQVSVDGGLRGDRSLASADSGDTVSYEVFSDAARTVPYIIGSSQPIALDTSGAPTEVPLYGAIAANGSAIASGLYTDTLLVKLEF
ncbi:Csu type fimbrial protein [Halotalea alkalilenta]|uniref:Csu type fimbrial protein n=1 Tax=Halotalea alkalilenta TaxID=376489 RepID=UPI000480237C|nr:spore coat U domain-containing protein [Halotalea alkalilenta]